MFQSTRPRGARLIDCAGMATDAVSIHAPAWGATTREPLDFVPACFNPRARVGRDLKIFLLMSIWQFQSTRPRGARPRQGLKLLLDCRFNPRARVGRDVLFMVLISIGLFQSTRPRGARPCCFALQACRLVSIHAPAWGATRRTGSITRTQSFNPRARVGRDLRMVSR